MADRFPYGSSEPSPLGFAITPADGDDLPNRIRAVTIGTAAGVIKYDNWEGVTCTTNPLPIGLHPFYAKRIWNTGTTATGLTGWV